MARCSTGSVNGERHRARAPGRVQVSRILWNLAAQGPRAGSGPGPGDTHRCCTAGGHSRASVRLHSGGTYHCDSGDTMTFPRTLGKTKGVLAASALVLAGFGGGAVLAATGTADAVTGTSSSTSTTGHSGETALTGTTAAKVKAAALAKYPGATIERVETDSDGIYEAHLTTKAGDEVTVQVDKSFAATGTQTSGGYGDHDGDATDSSSSTS